MASAAGFALVAVLIAGIGIYTAVRRRVALRTKEFAIRMSLGAEPARLQGNVVRNALKPVTVGIAAGLLRYMVVTWLDHVSAGVRDRQRAHADGDERRADVIGCRCGHIAACGDRMLVTSPPRCISGSGHAHERGLGGSRWIVSHESYPLPDAWSLRAFRQRRLPAGPRSAAADAHFVTITRWALPGLCVPGG